MSGVVSEYKCGWLIPNTDFQVELGEVHRCDNVRCCHSVKTTRSLAEDKEDFIEVLCLQMTNDSADKSS